MSASPAGLKRARQDTEPDSQEVPEKRVVLDPLLKPSQLEEKTPKPEHKNGLFKKSELKTTEDYQKTLQKLEEKQMEVKKPIILRDPTKDYYPEGKKPEESKETAVVSGKTVNFGVFGSQKKLGSKETEAETKSNLLEENSSKCLEENEVKCNKDKTEDKSTNPFAKALTKTSGFGGGFGGGGFSKPENGMGGFSRLAGVTSSSWSTTNNTDNLKPEKSQDTKENLKTEDFRTGEEDEKNVLEVTTAKLFKFDKKTQQYNERGRGILRMNDKGEGSDFSSRLVFRTAGTQRVALNTQIWGGMSVEQCTPKSIRISAQDDTTEEETEVGIFLIQCGVEQSKKLFSALDYRILQIKQKEEK